MIERINFEMCRGMSATIARFFTNSSFKFSRNHFPRSKVRIQIRIVSKSLQVTDQETDRGTSLGLQLSQQRTRYRRRREEPCVIQNISSFCIQLLLDIPELEPGLRERRCTLKNS